MVAFVARRSKEREWQNARRATETSGRFVALNPAAISNNTHSINAAEAKGDACWWYICEFNQHL